MDNTLVMRDEVYHVIGAAMEVHRQLGPGFLEPVYQEALEVELTSRGIPFTPQQRLIIRYKDRILEKEYIADLVCYEQLIVELKAIPDLTDREEAQILNYLKASNLPVGILINFGSLKKLEWRRFAYTKT
ncbi:MAG: GxxExxY protein [Anaerolineaceae bacterium]